MFKYLCVTAVLLLSVFVLVAKHRGPNIRISSEELAAKEDLLSNIKLFSGCFQPLADALQNGNIPLVQKLMYLWQSRSVCLPALSAYLSAVYTSNTEPLIGAQAWINTLERWNIQHDTPDYVFKITTNHEKLYLFDDVYSIGDHARILRPAWWIQQKDFISCIETGAAKIIEGEPRLCKGR